MTNKNLLNADGFAFECPLVDSLDSSVKNSIGISGGVSGEGNEIYYNTSDKVFHNVVDPELIKAGLATTTAVVSGVSQSRAGQVCKRPLVRENALNRGKWSAYRDCLDREAKKQAAAVAIAEANARAKELELQAARGGSDIDMTGDDKILGMPKGLAIGLGVVLALGISFVGYKIYKSNKG